MRHFFPLQLLILIPEYVKVLRELVFKSYRKQLLKHKCNNLNEEYFFLISDLILRGL